MVVGWIGGQVVVVMAVKVVKAKPLKRSPNKETMMGSRGWFLSRNKR